MEGVEHSEQYRVRDHSTVRAPYGTSEDHRAPILEEVKPVGRIFEAISMNIFHPLTLLPQLDLH
jgi:hypothetical protein